MAHVKIKVDAMTAFCLDVFQKFGFTAEESKIITDVLMLSDVYGIESHGAQRLVRYHKGISSGMPLIFRAAFKPTPSIGRVQKTLNVKTMTPTELTIKGRHDPCIVPRAVPVVEAACAVALCDALLPGDYAPLKF